MTARSWLWTLLLACAACSSGGVPALDTPQSLPGATLLLAPDLRLVLPQGTIDVDALGQVLQHELKESLAGYGVNVSDGQQRQDLDRLRAEMVTTWERQRGKGSGRYHSGTKVPLGDAASAEAARGTRVVLLGVLYQEGVLSREDGYVPLPPDYLPTLPEARPDYEVPQTGSAAGGLSLELLAVDLATGRVVAQRRASYPATSTAEITNAIPILAREVARGLSSSGTR